MSGYLAAVADPALQSGVPNARWDALGELVRECVRRGLQVHPWYSFTYYKSPSSPEFRAHPECRAVRLDELLPDPKTRKQGFSIGNTPMVNDPLNSTVVQLSRSPVAGKPYTVSEINHPFPNEYACEGIGVLAARDFPRDRLLVETDGPFLTPQPHRGKRNEPGYVKHVAEFIARSPEIDPIIASQAAQTGRNLPQVVLLVINADRQRRRVAGELLSMGPTWSKLAGLLSGVARADELAQQRRRPARHCLGQPGQAELAVAQADAPGRPRRTCSSSTTSRRSRARTPRSPKATPPKCASRSGRRFSDQIEHSH